jgi:Flp pilus assembly pilin Flp
MTQRLWSQEGQDVAEYAVILAVVVLPVVVTVRLIGTSSTSIFSAVGSSITQ